MSNINARKSDEILITLHDKDIFQDTTDLTSVVWNDRPIGKVVLFNEDSKIALIGNKVNNFFSLPGGGIEGDESILDGIMRECKEETGCEIEIKDTLGMTEDFRLRDSRHCISFGYSAKVTYCGTPALTESEVDIGAYVKWVSLSEAIELFVLQERKVRAGEVKFYNTCFNTIRDSLFIHRAKTLSKESS